MKMLKRFVLYLSVICVTISAHAADDFSFENFAIVDSADADINAGPVTLNADAGAVNVAGFDIAGIMLGMAFEDVQTLFFKTKGLYAPRQKNSIIYNKRLVFCTETKNIHYYFELILILCIYRLLLHLKIQYYIAKKRLTPLFCTYQL